MNQVGCARLGAAGYIPGNYTIGGIRLHIDENPEACYIQDNAAVAAFRRWRFKRGTPNQIKVPITFTLTGAMY